MALSEQNKLLEEQKLLRNQIVDIQIKGSELTSAQQKDLKKLQVQYKKVYIELTKINIERLEGFADSESSIKSLGSMYKDLGNLDRDRIKNNMKFVSLSDEQNQHISKAASINREIAQLSISDVAQHEILNEKYKLEVAGLGQLHWTQQSITRNLEEQNKLAQRHTTLSNTQKEVLEGQHSVLDGIKKTIVGTIETFTTLYGNVGGAFGGLVTMAGLWEHKVTDVNKELGFTVLDMNSAAKSAGVLSFMFDDVAGSIKGLTDEFGTIESATMGTQFNVNAIASLMGISNTEAAQLTGQFARMNNGSADIAADMIQTTKEYAKQNNVIPSQVLSDLAGSAEAFAIFAKEGGKNLIKAATGARQLGTDLQTVTGIADNLLDFETSMTKELELGAMLGRNINLNKARQLAYDGDILQATEEVLRQVGGIAEFNRMDYFQKRATADLLGVSVSELKKMADNQKNLGTSGSVITEQFSKWGASLNLITNKYLGHGIEALGGWITASAQVGANFDRLGFPISNVIKGTGQILKNLWSMTGGSMIKKIGSLGTSLSGLGGSQAGKTGMLGKIKEKIFKGVGGSKTPTIPTNTKIGGKGSITDSLGKINMTKVLKGAAALVIVAGAVFIFGKAVQEFMKVSWQAVGMAVVSMLALVGAVALLGAIMSSGVGAVAILAGAAAMIVVAASVYILGKAIQEMAIGFSAMETIGSTISGLVSMIGGISSLTASFIGLAGSLALLGTAGLIALPALMGLSIASEGLGFIADIMGVSKSEPTTAIQSDTISEYHTQMLSKMDKLINAVQTNKDVYLDKEKVTSIVMKTSEKHTGNVFGLGVA